MPTYQVILERTYQATVYVEAVNAHTAGEIAEQHANKPNRLDWDPDPQSRPIAWDVSDIDPDDVMEPVLSAASPAPLTEAE